MFEALPIAFDSSYFYSTILTKNESHLAHFDHARYPYISLKGKSENLKEIKVGLTFVDGTGSGYSATCVR